MDSLSPAESTPIAGIPHFLTLRTSSFHAFFDQETGFLRRVSVGGCEVLRAIYGAVRDRDWTTVPPVFSDVRLRGFDRAWSLTFRAECRAAGIHFTWRGEIRGADGEFEFTFDGEALTTFAKNRIGLCVLHPIAECAGRPCRILKTSGAWEDGRFPQQIAPHQPFADLRGLAWEPRAGLHAELRFDGDVFETEDQRNWTDASFKSYSTPLALPKPVEIAAGTRVRQRVLLRVSDQNAAVHGWAAPTPEIRIAANPESLRPPIGLCSAPGVRTPRETALLRTLGLSHLRVDLRLAEEDWQSVWEEAMAEAEAIGVALHVALFLPTDSGAALHAFAALARNGRVPVAMCMIFHAAGEVVGAEMLALATQALSPLRAAIATGTNANFAEFNRQRPPAAAVGCFSATPQVHAFDDFSVMENLAALPDTIASAQDFFSGPIAVSPITLRPRGAAETRLGEALPFNVDPRQRTLFAAAWTLGCLARLLPVSGVHSLTFCETVGWRGVMEREAGSSQTEAFRAEPGEVFPLALVLRELANCPRTFALLSSSADCVASIGLIDVDGRRRLLLANLLPVAQTVRIAGVSEAARAAWLDQPMAARCAQEPDLFYRDAGVPLQIVAGAAELPLPPYAVARLRW